MDDFGPNPISITMHDNGGASVFKRWRISLDPRVSHALGGTAIVQALLIEAVDNDPVARVDYDASFTERHVWIVALPHDLAGRIARKAHVGVTGALRRTLEAAWRAAA